LSSLSDFKIEGVHKQSKSPCFRKGSELLAVQSSFRRGRGARRNSSKTNVDVLNEKPEYAEIYRKVSNASSRKVSPHKGSSVYSRYISAEVGRKQVNISSLILDFQLPGNRRIFRAGQL